MAPATSATATMFVGPSGATSSTLSSENVDLTPSGDGASLSFAAETAIARTTYGLASRDASRAAGLAASMVSSSSNAIVSMLADHF